MSDLNIRTLGAGSRRRYCGLVVVCLGVLLVVLESTAINVALPLIHQELAFTERSLVWVVNAYLLTFGGFLLVSGRMGDLYGHRRLFLVGLALFTAASLVSGLTESAGVLIAARALQGLAGSILMAVALSLIAILFPDGSERASAIGVYGFVCGIGGSVGLLLGGALTSVLSWRWIFLINLPIGSMVYVACVWLLPSAEVRTDGGRVDIWGAITLILVLMTTIYAVLNGHEVGWTSVQQIELLGCALVSLASFAIIESRASRPLMPFRVFANRNLAISNVVGILAAVSGSAWFFISALYMQLVLGYGPMQISLSFLPAIIIMAVLSLGISGKLVTRFGIKRPLSVGLLLMATGLAVLARAPLGGNAATAVLPGMILLGVGNGVAYNPLLCAALQDVDVSESGLASGVVSTTSMMGSSLGLAFLASLAAARTDGLLATGFSSVAALAAGFRLAFLAGAFFAAAAAVVSISLLRTRVPASKLNGTTDRLSDPGIA